MALSKKELLRPRFKVVADYPGNEWAVGSVLEKMKNTAAWLSPCNNINIGMRIEAAEKYPHLFQKLEWWQERTKEDMPKYVIDDEGIMGELGGIYSHNLKNCVMVTYPNGNAVVSHLDNFKPVSEEEYNQYIKQQSKQ